MADEDRRGCSLLEADGDAIAVTQTNIVEGENRVEVGAEVVPQPAESGASAVCVDGLEKLSLDEGGAGEHPAEGVEDAKTRLLKLKDELGKAKAELARANNDVEKVRSELELTEATVDSDQSSKGAADELLDKTEVSEAPAEVLQVAEEQVPEAETVTVNESLSSGDVKLCKDEVKASYDLVVNDLDGEGQYQEEDDVAVQEFGGSEVSDSAKENCGEYEDDVQEECGESDEEDVPLEGEREEGDGEESEKNTPKPLDDDEDRRNPQYIPKRGGFYEHDDRGRDEGEAPVEEPVAEDAKPKKGMRSEVLDRWGHDKFDEREQMPKSDQELVSLYGYDIRKEEGAPRARRRRRYGRGPNKYSRTWEDEEAYSKMNSPRGGGSSGPRRGGRGGHFRGDQGDRPAREEFPPLMGKLEDLAAQQQSATTSNWREAAPPAATAPADVRSMDNGKGAAAGAISFRRGGGGRTFEERKNMRGEIGESKSEDNHEAPARMTSPSSNDNKRAVRGTLKSPRADRGNFPSGGDRGNFPSGGDRSHLAAGGPPRGGGPSGRLSRGGRGGMTSSSHSAETKTANWERHRDPDVGSGGAADSRGRGRHFQRPPEQEMVAGVQQQQNAPRSQDPSRSKRYSSQRQRVTTPPPGAAPAGVVMPPSFVPGVNQGYYSPYNDSPTQNFGAPSTYADASTPLMPIVAAQGAPPAYMPQPLGFPAAAAAAAPFAGTFQPYAPAAAPPVQVGVPIASPTQEMYAGGIMYYDTERQSNRHSSQPMRRAKAAIPIVAPGNGVENSLISAGRHVLEH